MEDKQLDALERFLKFGENYGLSFVFLCCFLLIILYVAITIVRISKTWVVAWFQWSIKSHQRTIRFMDAATESINCIHDKTHADMTGQRHFAKAALSAAGKHRHQLGSDVIIHLEEASRIYGYEAAQVVHQAAMSPPPKSPEDTVRLGEIADKPDEPSPLEKE